MMQYAILSRANFDSYEFLNEAKLLETFQIDEFAISMI